MTWAEFETLRELDAIPGWIQLAGALLLPTCAVLMAWSACRVAGRSER